MAGRREISDLVVNGDLSFVLPVFEQLDARPNPQASPIQFEVFQWPCQIAEGGSSFHHPSAKGQSHLRISELTPCGVLKGEAYPWIPMHGNRKLVRMLLPFISSRKDPVAIQLLFGVDLTMKGVSRSKVRLLLVKSPYLSPAQAFCQSVHSHNPEQLRHRPREYLHYFL